jgi:hypothetical protein
MITITCRISWMSPVRLRCLAVDVPVAGREEVAWPCRDDEAHAAVPRIRRSERQARRVS